MSKPVAVITGVGAGLGASLARKFAAEGCAVAMLARSQGFINDLARTIASDGGKAIGVPADVTSQEAVSAAFECIRKELGPTDILINHAGNATWSMERIFRVDPVRIRALVANLCDGRLPCMQRIRQGYGTARLGKHTLHWCHQLHPWTGRWDSVFQCKIRLQRTG